MKKMMFALALGAFAFHAGAWDYEGHHAVNELALASLPPDFGIQLTPELKNRIAFLAGEPDRWRNTPDLPLKHFNGPDHYIDLEDIQLLGLTPDTLPPLRYDFVADIALARALLTRPSLLLLDEPFTGLDRDGALALGEQLGQLRDAGAIVVVVTHDLEAIAGRTDHVAILRRGQLVFEERGAYTYEQLKDVYHRHAH